MPISPNSMRLVAAAAAEIIQANKLPLGRFNRVVVGSPTVSGPLFGFGMPIILLRRDSWRSGAIPG